jgi:hypothetical protein
MAMFTPVQWSTWTLPFEIQICIAQPTCTRWFGIWVELKPGWDFRVARSPPPPPPPTSPQANMQIPNTKIIDIIDLESVCCTHLILCRRLYHFQSSQWVHLLSYSTSPLWQPQPGSPRLQEGLILKIKRMTDINHLPRITDVTHMNRVEWLNVLHRNKVNQSVSAVGTEHAKDGM